MANDRMTIEVYYIDGRVEEVTISFRALVAFEIAHDKSFGEALETLHGQTWVAWRQCQLSGIEVPAYDEWLDTVTRLFMTMPDPPAPRPDG